MGADLAPLSLAIPSLIRRATVLYWERFGLFLAATVVVQLPATLLALIVGYAASSTLDAVVATPLPQMPTVEDAIATLLSRGAGWLVGYGLLLVASSVLNVIATVVSSGALAYLLAVDGAGPDAFGTAYRIVLQRLGPLFGAVVLAGFIICAVLILVLAILVFLAAVQYMLIPAGEAPPVAVQVFVWLLLCLLLVGGMGYAVFATVRWALFVQAVVLENAGPAEALRRSAVLVRGHWWRTAALLTVLVIGQAAVGTLVSALLRAVLLGYADGALAALAGGLGWTAANLVCFPVAANALTLFYLALRAREPAPAGPVV
jgi:hypothetical protein